MKLGYADPPYPGCAGQPDDELHDLYPGTGAITKAWDSWSRLVRKKEAA